MQTSHQTQKKEDLWIHSSCDQCLGECGILAHRVNGVVTEIKGDPDCPNSRGKICPKGHAAIMNLYDPNRVLKPMKRTNPEKGLNVDPGWEEISWEEAINILSDKLAKIRKDDPRKLVLSTFDTYALVHWLPIWTKIFGTPNTWIVYFCGQYLHSSMYLTNGTFHCDFDIHYCNYLLLVGNQAGFSSGLNPNITIQEMAKARKRGLKVVAMEPVANHAASKADEWLPVRPGTDAAVLLAMCNVLVNELGQYDVEFLKKNSNSPYLVKPDGTYLKEGDKPLMWDPVEKAAKPYDANFSDYAIEGTYEVDGISCRPAFEFLKDHLSEYSPEMAEEISTVPAAQIRKVAKEFVEAACIGQTITLDGVTFPYRPAAVNIYRGAGSHKHGVSVALVSQLMNLLVGSLYVPGSHRGTNAVGPRADRDSTLRFEDVPDWAWGFGEFEGLVAPTPGLPRAPNYYKYITEAAKTVTLRELYPLSSTRSATAISALTKPGDYNLPYKPEMLINCRRNPFQTGFNYEATIEAIETFDYIVSFATHFDEITYYTDLLLPEQVGMEKLQVFPNLLNWGHSNQTREWYWGLKQPVVEKAMGEARDWQDVMMEVTDRIGMREELYEAFNESKSLSDALSDEYKLDTSKKYTAEEIADRRIKSKFGEEKNLDWFKQNGYVSFKRTADEMYPLPWLKQRFPIYHELFIRAGRDMEKLVEELGMKEWDLGDYEPLPTWKPCASYCESHDGFDLTAVNYKIPTHAQTHTASNPWLSEVAEVNPYSMKVLVNAVTAKRKGISDGDNIYVESGVGKVKGVAKVTECIHPEVIGMACHFGSLSEKKPIAYGKGTTFCQLLPGDLDPVSTGVDACVKVKVYKR